MFVGMVAILRKDGRMTNKYLGLSPVDYFVSTKARFAKENFVLIVEDTEVYKLLCDNLEGVILLAGDEHEALMQAANLLAAKSETIAVKTDLLNYSALDAGVKVYAVYSEANDKVDSDIYMRVAAFVNMMEKMCDPSTYKRMFRLYINSVHEANGVEFMDENAAYIEATVKIGMGCVIYPNVFLEGNTEIGENTVLYPGCRLTNTHVGTNCTLQYVIANEAVVEDNVTIGPFVNLRPNTVICKDVKIGDFVEVKNSTVGRGSKLPHLSYIGDSDVGERVNVGCGTVFVNYDGKFKHRTTIGNDVFIGCNSNLVAPISIGDNVYIAAGSTLTSNAPDGVLAIARARQINKEGWIPPYKRE